MHTNSPIDIVALDARAVRASVALVAQLTAEDLARPTPCADWTLHGLLRHMIAQHHGFAAASEGAGDLTNWRVRPLGDDPAGAYRAAAERVLSAFAVEGVLDRDFPLPSAGTALATAPGTSGSRRRPALLRQVLTADPTMHDHSRSACPNETLPRTDARRADALPGRAFPIINRLNRSSCTARHNISTMITNTFMLA